MVTIATYGDTFEANLAKCKVEAGGVPVFLADEQSVNVAWHLTNAMGGVKLQVAEEDVDEALAILNGSEVDESADEVASGQAGDSIEKEQPDSEAETLQLEEDPTESDDWAPTNIRELNAGRALRGALLGFLFFPFQLYVFWLLIRVFLSDEPLSAKPRRNAIMTACINIPFIMVLLVAGKALLMD